MNRSLPMSRALLQHSTTTARAVPRRLERLLAGFTALVGTLIFVVGGCLEPYDQHGQPRTLGTHRQLGLPPCTLVMLWGIPCPSCGMTTSVSLLMHGDPVGAWRANWAGVFVSVAGVVAAAWLWLLAGGFPRCDMFSAENVVLYLTVGGATLVVMRYVVLMSPVLWVGGTS